MEDPPCFQGWLLIHFVLDLPINFSSTSFNVKGISITTSFGPHNHIPSLVLVTLQGAGSFFEFEVPSFLFLNALGIRVKDFKEIFAFVDLSVSVSVYNLSKILHESEVCSHRVSQTSDLTEFWNQGNLNTSFSVFVDKERLVTIIDSLIVSGLVVVLVGNLK